MHLRLPRLSTLTFVALNVLGLVAYLAPFVSSGNSRVDPGWFEHNTDAPLLFAAVAALCMVLIVAELTGGGAWFAAYSAAEGVTATSSGELWTVS